MTVYKNPVSVLVLIHTPDLSILLLERSAHPGFWQSVTGSLEDGETPLAAAQRETLEETGLHRPASQYEDWHHTNRFTLFPEWRHRYAPDVTHNCEHVFSLCVPPAHPIHLAPTEHRASCWLPWQEAADIVFSWSNRDAIQMLPERIRRGA